MPTSPPTITVPPAEAAVHDGPQRVAAIVVRRGDPDSRRAVCKIATERAWRVAAVFEAAAGGGEVQKVLLAEAHGGAFQALAIPSLSVLAPTPAAALGVVAACTDLDIAVAAVSEPWLFGSQCAVAHVARWFDRANREQRAQKIKASMAQSGRKPGRPRRFVPILEAQRLVVQEGMSVGGAARLLGLPESTLRRALAERRAEERLASIMVPATLEEAA